MSWLKGKKRGPISDEHRNKLRKNNGKYIRTEINRRLASERTSKFMRGRISWARGLTKEMDSRIADKARKRSKTLEERFKNDIDFRNRIISNLKGGMIGKKHREESKRRIGDRLTGSQNGSWNNGSSFGEYGIEFNGYLKEQIRKRDNYRCQQCFRHQDELFDKNGRRKKLAIHHIDYDKKNNHPSNLISLCNSCHMQTNFSRKDWIEYFKNKVNI